MLDTELQRRFEHQLAGALEMQLKRGRSAQRRCADHGRVSRADPAPEEKSYEENGQACPRIDARQPEPSVAPALLSPAAKLG
jgi:hypothetical protein